MSQENVEIVRRMWEVYEERGLDAVLEFFDESINWRAVPGAVDDAGELNGVEAMRRYLGDWLETFADVSTVPTEILDLGGDRVLATLRVSGRARLSGIETGLSYAVVYTLREGKIVQGREYVDRAEALKAVGLEG
jgi:ketosteroid isomerase-like protein